jgi:hypothetical protein
MFDFRIFTNWPESAEWNLHLNRVVGFDESGFAGESLTRFIVAVWAACRRWTFRTALIIHFLREGKWDWYH